MPRKFAEDRGFHLTPPSPQEMAALVANYPEVRRINRLPVLPSKSFSAADVGDLTADPSTAFLVDDNDRYHGGQPFQNGEQFYYFVAARDVLGRDGLLSQPVLVTVCDRLPPDAPRGVRVVNAYWFDETNAHQRLKVIWLQNTNKEDGKITCYYVYRWNSPEEPQLYGGVVTTNPPFCISGPIPHVPGKKYAEFIDQGPGAPTAPTDYGKTYWYTVRAVDDGACGGNFSPHSAPAFGVLRDRSGPDGPDGGIQILCCRPVVRPGESKDSPDSESQDETRAYYQLVVYRTTPWIEWAELGVNTRGSGQPDSLAILFFPQGEGKVTFRWSVDRSEIVEKVVHFYCRAGMQGRKVSSWAQVTTYGMPQPGQIRMVSFEADVDCSSYFTQGLMAQTPCGNTHHPHPGGGTTTNVPPIIILKLTPGTKEYRLYRRVDDGPLTLISQGEADYEDAHEIQIPDLALPANASKLCYYGQLFDEHGNPSPLVRLGCITVSQPLPTPLLSPLEPAGDVAKPQMKIRWFCPPHGVERFEVAIAASTGSMPSKISDELSEALSGSPVWKTYTIQGKQQTNSFWIYRTFRIGPGFGNGAEFLVTVDIELGVQYIVTVAAVGKDGNIGPDSNAETFLWNEPVSAQGPLVPWPARPLPPQKPFSEQVRAVYLPDQCFPGVGIRIGEVEMRRLVSGWQKQGPIRVYGAVDPVEEFLYKDSNGETLFPVVVYRFQVPSSEYPQVSGDVIQVSPLMEQIAYNQKAGSNGIETEIVDPFIRLCPDYMTGGQNETWAGLYLVDTQPVLSGATYQYVLLRLGPNGEIIQVIPLNKVTIVP